MSKFDYPRLPRQEIVAALVEYQIAAVSEGDLIRPDSDFICNLYGHVYLHMGTHQDEELQLEFDALELIENPDNHAHSIPIVDLYNKIRQILKAVKCPKTFTLKDLIKPEPERTELFLSALLNFMIHRFSKKSLLQEPSDALNQLADQEQVAKERMSKLEEEIKEYEQSIEKELPLIQAINSQIKELHQTVSGLNHQQATLRTSIKQIKENSKEMDEKISEAESALARTVQENANLRSRIVQSPDKLQRALEEKKMVQIEVRNSERASSQKFQDKTTLLEAHTKACKKINKHLQTIQILQEQANSAKSVDKDVKVLKNKLSEEEVSIKSLEAKLLELQSREDQLKEQKKQVDLETILKKEEIDKEYKILESEVEAKRQAFEIKKREVESLMAEAEAMSSKKEAAKQEGEAKMRLLGSKCEEVMTEFNKYADSMKQLIGRQ